MIRSYDLYWGNTVIGKFIENWGVHGCELSIELNENYYKLYKNDVRLFDFDWITEHTYNMTDKLTRHWINSRVIDKNRRNLNEILQQMHMTDYDQLSILHYMNAITLDDHYWIDFDDSKHKSFNYDTDHPRGSKYFETKVKPYLGKD